MGAFFSIILCYSCASDDSVTIIETVEELKYSFKMDVNGVSLEADAFAAYCKNDSIEFVMIANKEANLTWPLQPFNFEVDDYVYFKSISDSYTWSYGGQALSQEVTGFPGLSVSFSDAEMNIELNDGEIIVGSAEGVLYNMDGTDIFNEYTYAMNFIAEIKTESDFCQ